MLSVSNQCLKFTQCCMSILSQEVEKHTFKKKEKKLPNHIDYCNFIKGLKPVDNSPSLFSELIWFGV